MGKASRDKGARGEREVADIFRAAGFTECVRSPNSGGLMYPGDILGVDGVHVETKRWGTRMDIPGAMAQVYREAEGDTLPLLAFRRDRSPSLSLFADPFADPLGYWHGVVGLAQLATLLKLAEDWEPQTAEDMRYAGRRRFA